MNRMLTRGLLIAGALLAAVSPALAQFTVPPQQGAGQPAPRGPDLRLAERLSALETQVGIGAAQAPAWRAYADALLAFAASGPPRQPPQAPPPAGPAAGEPPREPRKLLMGEILAAQGMGGDAGEKAEALKKAAAGLRAALSEAQLARLLEADAPPGERPPRP